MRFSASFSLLLVVTLIGFAIFPSLSSAQTGVDPSFELPQDPRVWLNGTPISTKVMRGKSIVLYFFEEGCPRCREKWPAVLAAAKQAEGFPVMLIGVNSGNSTATVSRYLRENQITIPVIVDTNRSFEKYAGVPEVSLQNIYQARVVNPAGELVNGIGGDIPATLADAAGNASWNVDPASIPAVLLPTWKQIEFGSFQGTAKTVEQFRKNPKEEVKAAAEQLHQYVNEKYLELTDEADAAKANGELWKAFALYTQVATEFQGYDYPESVEQSLQELKDDDEIKRQTQAMKQWLSAARVLQSGKASPVRIAGMLNRLVEKYPDTEAAELAQNALASAGISGN